ncbi:hypothetical protein Y032_0107g3831 [Ancylostoma ceylanicum]|nr:hypothetical protein Y032_0107g3831 [Ancylostoma ceylanicum]
MDPPPCGCVRLPTGKKKRCKKHRMERRARRKAKSKARGTSKEKGTRMVKDDESDRKKMVELRHAADSESDEDKAIDGAFTPDKVCAVGPTGVAVLVEIEKVETAEVGQRAKMTDKRMRGILVKGAHETPQFIPDEKIQKDSSGKPKYRYYTAGELVKGCHGEAIFYADGQCQCDKQGNPQNMTVAGVDQNIQKKVGDTLCVPVEVEVNEKGMPVVKQIACAEDVPKDKNAAMGLLTKNQDGYVVFTQTAGQKLGASANAPCVACTPGEKVEAGCVIGKIVEDKQGKTAVLPVGVNPTSDQKVTGAVLQGTYHEPVYVKDVKKCECPPAQNLTVITLVEKEDKQNQQQIEKADVLVQSKVQNKTCQQIMTERAEVKAAKPIVQREVVCAQGSQNVTGQATSSTTYTIVTTKKTVHTTHSHAPGQEHMCACLSRSQSVGFVYCLLLINMKSYWSSSYKN